MKVWTTIRREICILYNPHKKRIKFEKWLTFIVILGGNCKDGVLYIFILINLCLVESLVKVGRVVVLVSNTNTNELCHWNTRKTNRLDDYLQWNLPFPFQYSVKQKKLKVPPRRIRRSRRTIKLGNTFGFNSSYIHLDIIVISIYCTLSLIEINK